MSHLSSMAQILRLIRGGVPPKHIPGLKEALQEQDFDLGDNYDERGYMGRRGITEENVHLSSQGLLGALEKNTNSLDRTQPNRLPQGAFGRYLNIPPTQREVLKETLPYAAKLGSGRSWVKPAASLETMVAKRVARRGPKASPVAASILKRLASLSRNIPK